MAANPDILRKAQLDEADALVATTGSDSTNTVIAMLGSRFEVEAIVVKLNDTGLRPACLEMGVTYHHSEDFRLGPDLRGPTRLGPDGFLHGHPGGMRLVEVTIHPEESKRLSELKLPDA